MYITKRNHWNAAIGVYACRYRRHLSFSNDRVDFLAALGTGAVDRIHDLSLPRLPHLRDPDRAQPSDAGRPSRQLRSFGAQPNSAFTRAFEAPRCSVMT